MGGRRFHLRRLGIGRSKCGGASNNSLMLGRADWFSRRHSSIGTRTASSIPRRVTICGPCSRAAFRNSLKRDLASCSCQELMRSPRPHHMTSHLTSQSIYNSPAFSRLAAAPPPVPPAAGVHAPRLPYRALHSLPESLPPRTLCTRRARRWRAETRAGAASLPAPAATARPPAEPDLTALHPAGNSSALRESWRPRLENVWLRPSRR